MPLLILKGATGCANTRWQVSIRPIFWRNDEFGRESRGATQLHLAVDHFAVLIESLRAQDTVRYGFVDRDLYSRVNLSLGVFPELVVVRMLVEPAEGRTTILFRMCCLDQRAKLRLCLVVDVTHITTSSLRSSLSAGLATMGSILSPSTVLPAYCVFTQ